MDGAELTNTDVTEIPDAALWYALTLAEAQEMDGNGDDPTDPDHLPYDSGTYAAEIDRRWGPDALERVAEVITGGKFSPDDEMRWLDNDPASFLRLVRGEETPDDFFNRW